MNIADFDRVGVLAHERRHLLGQIELASRLGRFLAVMIQGYYQDERMLDAVRPVVIAELRRRLEPIELELEQLGVRVDDHPQPPT